MEHFMEHFITTCSKETADLLAEAGYVLLNDHSGKWTFLNDPKIKFSEMKNVRYTNMLNI